MLFRSFRCSPGGAQGYYGITPDLTTLAKLVAGGLPGGFPDLSQMPEGLNELPPGLADFDLSKLKFPGKQ